MNRQEKASILEHTAHLAAAGMIDKSKPYRSQLWEIRSNPPKRTKQNENWKGGYKGSMRIVKKGSSESMPGDRLLKRSTFSPIRPLKVGRFTLSFLHHPTPS